MASLASSPESVASPATDKSKRRGVVFDAGMQHCVTGSRKRPRTLPGRTANRLRGRVGAQIRDLRTDAGISLRRLAEEAGVDHGFLARVERGSREPSLSVLVAIAEALGADLSIRLYPNTGPLVRDHIQARSRRRPRWVSSSSFGPRARRARWRGASNPRSERRTRSGRRRCLRLSRALPNGPETDCCGPT
jgi:transcriptional regulator with XRE-family HTH domain